VYQRNSLEPFLFTFCLFNQECRYKTSAWHTLGYIPDFENMSSATHCVSRGGFIGKSQSCHNFHSCLEVLLNPLIGDQGKSTPIYVNIWFGDKVALCCIFFPVAYVMGDGLVPIKCVVNFWDIQMSTKLAGVMLHFMTLTTLSVFVGGFQCIAYKERATKL